MILQPSHVAAKQETQAKPATNITEPKTAPTKIETKTSATKPLPVPTQTKTIEIPPSTKAKPELANMETTESIPVNQKEPETTPTPSAAGKQPSTTAPEQLIPEAELPDSKILRTEILQNKDEMVVIDKNLTEISKFQQSKPDLFKTESDAQPCKPPVSRFEDKRVPIGPCDAKVVPEKESKPEYPVPESIVTEVQPSDQIQLKEPTSSLQQVQLPLKSQEQAATEVKPIVAAEIKKVVKTEEKIDIILTQESQPVSIVRMTQFLLIFFEVKH